MGSSSKTKSSKKRSSKIHSQPRKMKKTRSISKKVTRRHDTSSDDSMSLGSISSSSNHSHSLYSDSDSMSSVSFSSSSSEGTYRGRKKVSRVRSNLSRRKRVRKRSSRSEMSEDFSRKKKRKRSRKNADSKSRKESQKNKPKRDVSSSSATNDSYGCSTYREGSDSFSEESEVQKLMIKSRKNKKHKRKPREERVTTKKRAPRSPSCSSYSGSGDQSYSVSRGEENFIGVSKSWRLRSVITFAEQTHEKEGNKSEMDSLKEEIFYDCDDYPSPRSNESSGGGSKRDLTSHSPVTLGDKRQEENVKGEETFVSHHRAAEPPESRKNADDQNVHDPFLNEVETNNYEKESRSHGSLLGASLGADDLEAVLRQKALENLRKFRGGIQRNVKDTANQRKKDDGDTNRSYSSKAQIVQRVLPKQDSPNKTGRVQKLDRSIWTTLKGEVCCLNEAELDIADGGNTDAESGIAKQKTVHLPDGLALSENPLKEDHMTTQAVAVKSESGNSLFGEKGSGTNSILNQAITSQASPDEKLSESMESERKIATPKTHSITPSFTNNTEAGVNNISSSATVELASLEQSTSRGQGSNEHQTEANDGSQFEQKTMSVMRGGETVQLSYKVYIPKRAAALARRQLKR